MGRWIRDERSDLDNPDALEWLVHERVMVVASAYLGVGCPVCGAGLDPDDEGGGCAHLLAVAWFDSGFTFVGPMSAVELTMEPGDEEVEDEGGDEDEDDDWSCLLSYLGHVLGGGTRRALKASLAIADGEDWIAIGVEWTDGDGPFYGLQRTLVAWPVRMLPPLGDGIGPLRAAIERRATEVGDAFGEAMDALDDGRHNPLTASAIVAAAGVGKELGLLGSGER